ncbi:tyrosine-type recombinase/integrase [Halobacteria archaeon AArc-m2/3/4]|uniref:Tyrosine-type recombinase/integrase n=1 Tax=Natronoglomus mannanivorans TaxID=2979990 RepID=A0ABT2QDC3_9EURY|nr:tyrosine-type recombinase/integrase [Halobacteria archaeon AArc-m2/3/4]
MSDLDPLGPWEAVDMYLEHRRDELAERTLSSHFYRLKQFCEWCDEEEIDNINDVNGRTLHRYKVYRRDEQGVAPTTLKGDFDTLRMFIGVCEALDAVEQGLKSKMLIPSVTGAEGVREQTLETNRAEEVLGHLERYEYASRTHAMLQLVWHVGMRTGGLRTIDLDDCDLEGEAPGIAIRHRPETDTPLKNQEAGERDVNVSEEVAAVLRDYIDVNRNDVTDEYGREPLFTSPHGRVSRACVQDWFYRSTRPCVIGNPCPKGRDPNECEAMEPNLATLCPDSVAPHAVRSGSITYQRRQGVPPEIVSDRVNASEDVIEKHYDMRTHRDRMQQRRQHLEGL